MPSAIVSTSQAGFDFDAEPVEIKFAKNSAKLLQPIAAKCSCRSCNPTPEHAKEMLSILTRGSCRTPFLEKFYRRLAEPPVDRYRETLANRDAAHADLVKARKSGTDDREALKDLAHWQMRLIPMGWR